MPHGRSAFFGEALAGDGAGGLGAVDADPPSMEVFRGEEGGAAAGEGVPRSVKNDHFWRVFETCLSGLPENQARLFMMREFLEFESGEICETLSITTSNLHVMLYRARLRLRECLENKWFLEGEKI